MQATFPVVTCPGCLIPMAQLVTEAIPNGLLRVTYRCESCSTETQGVFKSEEVDQRGARTARATAEIPGR
jgi:hypothetical protein